MRILYQHRTLADGAEGIHIAEMVEAFAALGHEVVMYALIASEHRGEGRPSVWGRLKAALPAPIFELSAVAFNVVEYIAFQLALRRYRPNVVYKRHAHFDAGIVLACRYAGVPLVLEVNIPYSSMQYRRFEPVRLPRIARLLERVAFANATLVAAVSSPLGELVREISNGRAQLLVVPNGANPQRFVPRDAPRDIRERLAPHGAVLVGWAGILRSWHGVDLLLSAAARVEHVHVAVIGDGPDRPRLERLACEFGIESLVHFTGRVSHDLMPAYIASLDIAVAADDRTRYASPMKLLEYMAMGKPVVAPRLPNIEELICDGVEGLLFAPGDAADLGRALSRLASNPALRQRCGRNGRLKIERERNWQAIARRILAHALATQ